MAFLSGSVYSKVMGMDTALTVVSPRKSTVYGGAPYQTVYMLHGLSDGTASWGCNAQLSLLADEYNVVFVMPEAQRSFYIDMAYGPAYFTYVADELPRLCQDLFRLSDRREDNFVFGLSMGGYGALKCALSRPEQYAGCGAFSSCCDLREALERPDHDEFLREAKAALGVELEHMEENDLFLLAKRTESAHHRPRIYMTCGTEDSIYEMSAKWNRFMMPMAYDFTYEEWPGTHNWQFWTQSVRRAMKHFFSEI